jgi:16S rRNA (cytosine967-C5)-methyltransferase
MESLIEATSSRRYIDEIVASDLGQFGERDRHLFQEIAYGAVRHRDTLDHLVGAHLKHPVRRQRLHVAWALRVGAYQLVYLDRIPAHAAVNQTVEAFKSLSSSGHGEVGFLNAVLHKIAGDIRRKSTEEPIDRNDPSVLPIRRGYCHFSRPVLPLSTIDPVGHLALKYSHPRWLLKRWVERFGEEETRSLCATNNSTPPLRARVTRVAPSREEVLAALEAEGWDVAPGPLDRCFTIEKARVLEESAPFRKGWFVIQDVTAVRAGEALRPPRGARVLDLCSAPGGKAALLLESLGPEGTLLCADRSETKLSLVRETLSRIGAGFRTVVLPEDPDQIDLGEKFSHALVDAPCSNTGVLARRPEARWRLRSTDLENLSRLQLRLVEAALRHLEPGGRILYATCSIEPEENENVVAQIASRHGDLVELETRLFLPHRTEGDGGFFSLLLRQR